MYNIYVCTVGAWGWIGVDGWIGSKRPVKVGMHWSCWRTGSDSQDGAILWRKKQAKHHVSS